MLTVDALTRGRRRLHVLVLVTLLFTLYHGVRVLMVFSVRASVALRDDFAHLGATKVKESPRARGTRHGAQPRASRQEDPRRYAGAARTDLLRGRVRLALRAKDLVHHGLTMCVFLLLLDIDVDVDDQTCLQRDFRAESRSELLDSARFF